MNINDVFGSEVEETIQEEYKQQNITPFAFTAAINYSKEDLMIDDCIENQYNSYIVNKSLSFSSDTVIQANEMNSRPFLDKRLQFSFLINTIRPRKRFNKWVKAEKTESIDIVKAYYGYSTEKAKQAISILSNPQLVQLKQKLEKGGL